MMSFDDCVYNPPTENLSMKVYNFKEILEGNGVENPEDSPLYHFCDCLDAIGVKIEPTGPWICGGSVLKTFLGQPLDTDIDLFFAGQVTYNDALTKMGKNAKLTRETALSHTFDCLFEHSGKEYKQQVQLVKYIFKPKASEIIDTFDLSVCQIAFDGERVVAPESSIEDMKNNRLTINVDKVTMPGSTLRRIIKYVKRGFTVDDKNLQAFSDRFLEGESEAKEKAGFVEY